ncbi:MAG: FtsX-like permease family protein [Candidatus Marinimicrobia bacterium]|nr:FtsX-like permease family protein [Candidatus Neomarinimicrobiota bacterium]
MIRHYLKIAWRNLVRQKGYSFISIFGLALGLTVCMTVLLYVKQELSYDKFLPDAERIYRVLLADTSETGVQLTAWLPESVGPGLQKDYPEVVDAVKLQTTNRMLIQTEGYAGYEDAILAAESSFLDIFGYELLSGNEENALSNPQSLILTASASQRYFNRIDVVGETVNIESNPYTVSAVIRDPPLTTHLHFELLLYRPPDNSQAWNVRSAHTYIKLAESARLPEFQAKLYDFVERTAYSEYSDNPAEGKSLILQPVTGIHLSQNPEAAASGLSPKTYLLIFLSAAVIILILASVNHINLITAQMSRRIKEIGVRKVVGARRRHLQIQFLGETILICALAGVFAVVFTELARSAIGQLLGIRLVEGVLADPMHMVVLVGLIVFTGILSGFYPAFTVSSYNPEKILKGIQKAKIKTGGFRRGLIVFQFASSVVLILATVIIHQQMEFVREQSIIPQEDEVVILQNYSPAGYEMILDENYNAFKNTLQSYPAIKAVSVGDYPGRIGRRNSYLNADGSHFTLGIFAVGAGYIETMNIQMAEGQSFSELPGTPEGNLVIPNETAVRELGIENPIGQEVMKLNGRVIGVAEDFHLESMYNEITPLVLRFDESRKFNIHVRIQSGMTEESLEYIHQTWSEFAGNRPLHMTHLSDLMNDAYQAELGMGRILSLFTLIALSIAALGLFGLSAYSVEQRTKEIGIRKVLGATVNNILVLLGREFFILVGIALTAGIPIAWILMQNWLQDFAYQTDINPVLFIVTGIGVLSIALLAVSTQALRAAYTNPTETLRYE